MSNSKRNLSVVQYFEQIQKEYLIAKFRSKIYFNPRDKAYYKRVMRYKSEKINEIAQRNTLKSILNDESKYEEYRGKLFNFGSPLFKLTEEDERNYYTKGNDFSYNGDVYSLEGVNEDGTLSLKSSDKIISVNKNKAFRIL